jgi:hypothetical protein
MMTLSHLERRSPSNLGKNSSVLASHLLSSLVPLTHHLRGLPLYECHQERTHLGR